MSILERADVDQTAVRLLNRTAQVIVQKESLTGQTAEDRRVAFLFTQAMAAARDLVALKKAKDKLGGD